MTLISHHHLITQNATHQSLYNRSLIALISKLIILKQNIVKVLFKKYKLKS